MPQNEKQLCLILKVTTILKSLTSHMNQLLQSSESNDMVVI